MSNDASNIPSVPRDLLPQRLKASHDRAVQQAGESQVVDVIAHSEAVANFFFDDFYTKLFNGGAVDLRFKQILRLSLSSAHGCRSCNLNNRHSALDAGLDEADIDALLRRDKRHFTGADKSVCELADELELCNTQGQLDAALYARLREHFDDAEIVELAMVGGVLTGVAKMLFTLNLVQREPYCQF